MLMVVTFSGYNFPMTCLQDFRYITQDYSQMCNSCTTNLKMGVRFLYRPCPKDAKKQSPGELPQSYGTRPIKANLFSKTFQAKLLLPLFSEYLPPRKLEIAPR